MERLSQYDVFLNHRGPDVKKTFVSHLNKALRQAGCDPFLDAKSLVKGQNALHSINEALIGARVHVAILSPCYAESKYCLNELCDMLESRKPLIPVFYNVEPQNLRCIEVGPFANAFNEHLEKGRDKDVVRWKAALLQVADITGFKLVDCDSNTAKLEEKIVTAVLDCLPALRPLAPAKHPVGLDKASAHVINILHKMGNSVGVLGICGMSGIGKTTLAREVYNQERSYFKSQCFLKDVEDAKGNGAVMDLQKKMVIDLLHVDAKDMPWDFACWFEKLQNRKVLLVVDNIKERKQFDELIPDLKELAPGSRVIITSQESGVLRSIMLGVKSELYYVPELSYLDSLDLFIRCAFQEDNIKDVDAVFHQFVQEIVSACGGLPLALELMGGFLVDKRNLPNDLKYWKEATLALRNNGGITTKIGMSYHGLKEDEDKSMFLDIACFMLGHSKEVAIEVWDSTGYYGSSSWSLKRLIDKCLVKVDADGQLGMHDLLRDMGRKIVTQRRQNRPEMQSHIWDPLEAAKVLQSKQGSDEILAFSLADDLSASRWSLTKRNPFKAELFSRMMKLRYLFLDGCSLKGNFLGWSTELKWVQWRWFPHQELPRSFKLQHLAVLDLANSHSLTHLRSENFRPHLWKGPRCLSCQKVEFPCQELRMLILSNCSNLKVLPQCINKLLKLKSMNLEGCGSLKALPDSLGELTDLEYLNLSDCSELSRLPDSMVNLLKLKELLVEGCWKLKTLPMEFGRLESLVLLKATSYILEELPQSFGQLQSLEEASFGQLQSLIAGDLTMFQPIKNLDDGFGCLGSLRKLSLSYCEKLTRLPDSFSNLSTLEELNLTGCLRLRKLCRSICGLKKLKALSIIETGIDEIPEDFGLLQSLTELTFKSCDQLETVCENFGSLGSLIQLNFTKCLSLTKLPDSFSSLSNLEGLYLSGCPRLQSLPPSIRGLRQLRVLRMKDTAIKELPEDFGRLKSLTEAYIGGCRSLTRLPDSFSRLSNLQTLKLDGCTVLQKLPSSILGLRNLQILSMGETALRELPEDFGQLQSLTSAAFPHCKQLQNLCENFGCLTSLQQLSLRGCENLTKLPVSFSNLSNLRSLDLSYCRLLQMLPPSMGWLKKLIKLELYYMTWDKVPEDFCQLSCEPSIDYPSLQRLTDLCPRGELRDYFASQEVKLYMATDGVTRSRRVKWSEICKAQI